MGKCYKQLSVDERNQMQRGLNAGQSLRALA
ncbi:helix-turn-helix domain-containing protein, partial [Acidithiobacillus ferriphilus]|nr:helix-turn-helix domain-containing protein [Acidithiobacillus ferriphilus]